MRRASDSDNSNRGELAPWLHYHYDDPAGAFTNRAGFQPVSLLLYGPSDLAMQPQDSNQFPKRRQCLYDPPGKVKAISTALTPRLGTCYIAHYSAFINLTFGHHSVRETSFL